MFTKLYDDAQALEAARQRTRESLLAEEAEAAPFTPAVNHPYQRGQEAKGTPSFGGAWVAA